MYIEQAIDLLPAYITGDLTTAEKLEIAEHIEKSEEVRLAYEQFLQLENMVAEGHTYPIPSSLSAKFYSSLAKEKAQNSTNKTLAGPSKAWYTVAASIALLLFALGWMAGSIQKNQQANESIARLEQEVRATKSLVMQSMLKEHSASQRIQAVNHSYELPKADLQLASTLLNTALYDPNLNVQLAAAEALEQFGQIESIRMATIKALEQASEPLLQLALIDLLIGWKEHKAIGVMQQLYTDPNTLPPVKERASSSFEVLM